MQYFFKENGSGIKVMKIDILTLFPEMFTGPLDHSIVKRAQEKGKVEIETHFLRRWTEDRHKTVDDRPFGGGVGLVLMVEPIFRALKDLKKKESKIILLSPQGKPFNQEKASKLSKEKHLIFVCGRYEGIDERIREHLIDEEISLGDFILTGGEIPAMAITDALVRLIPGVLEKQEAVQNESFSRFKVEGKDRQLLEYPQYTRPAKFNNWSVPKILLSGNHQKIDTWRLKKALQKTKKTRPDLL